MSCLTAQDVGGCGCTGCVPTSTVMCGPYPLTSTGSFVDSNGSGSLSTTKPSVFSGYTFASGVLVSSGPVNAGACVSATQDYNYYWGVRCNSDGTITTSVAYRQLVQCCGPGNFPEAGPVLYAPLTSSNAYTIYQTQTIVPGISGGNIVIPWTLPLWTNPDPTWCTMPSPPAGTATFTLPIGITCVNCVTCGSSGVQNPLYVTDSNGSYLATWNSTLSLWVTAPLQASSQTPCSKCTGGNAACNLSSISGTPKYLYTIACASSGHMTINRIWYELNCVSPSYQYVLYGCGIGSAAQVSATSGSVAVTCGSISWSGTLTKTSNLPDPVGGTTSFTQ